MQSPYFILIHAMISLVEIFSRFAVLYGLLAAMQLPHWTAVFLTTTVATRVAGFFFPLRGVTPAVVILILFLLVLGVAISERIPRNAATGSIFPSRTRN